jgi:hypothetical protein
VWAVRRPSPALLVALLALFVALGGPAEAKRLIDGSDIKTGSIRSRQIKNHTIAVKDISASAQKSLKVTPNGSVGTLKLASGAVTAEKLAPAAVTVGKLAPGAVTVTAIADGSVTGAKIADGSLTTLDVARFAGRFRVPQASLGTTVARHACWHGVPQGLAPEQAGADISQDALVVTPLSGYDDSLGLTARMAGANDPTHFVLALCNGTDADVSVPSTGIAFSYVIFDIP